MPTVFPDTVMPSDCATRIRSEKLTRVRSTARRPHVVRHRIARDATACTESNLDAILSRSRRRLDARNHIFINGNVRPYLVCGDPVLLEIVNRAVVDGHLRHHSGPTLHEYA